MSSVVGSINTVGGAVGSQGNRVARRGSLVRLAWTWLATAWEVNSSRGALAELDDRALSDLGISRGQARFEASRPFWDMRNSR